MTSTPGYVRFWDEALSPDGEAAKVAKLWPAIEDGALYAFVFEPPPPTVTDIAGDARIVEWGAHGKAIWTTDPAVARSLIAPAFGLRCDWLYIIVTSHPAPAENRLANWIELVVADKPIAGSPPIILAFDWGDFAPDSSNVKWNP